MANRPLTRETRAGVLVSRVLGVMLLGLVLLTMAVPRFSAIPYHRLGALAAFVVFLTLTVVLARTERPVEQRLARRLAVPVGVTCAAFAAFVGYASYYVTAWDSRLIQIFVSKEHEPVTPLEVAYLSRYPNNAVLFALARQVRSLGGALGLSYGTVFVIVQMICFGITLVGVHHLTVLVSDHAAALMAMVLLTALVGLSPWMAVPYTDIPSLWTPVWAVYCFVRAKRSAPGLPGAVWAAAGGAILALGYSLKVTPAVELVAGALWFLALATRGGSRGAFTTAGARLVAVLVGAVIWLVISGPVVTWLARAPQTIPGVAEPAWNYVADGLRVQVGPNKNEIFGGFDKPVNLATAGRPTDVQTQISKDFIRRELQRRGLVGTLLFEVNKLDFNWGDGMFWAYGEGIDLSRPPVHHGQPFELVQSWNSPRGQFFDGRVAITQGLWWLVLTLVGLGWLRGRVTAESLLLLVSLVGIAAFTLLFQGRSRYLVTYLPLLAVAAVWWWRDFWPGRGGRVRRPTVAPSPDRVPDPDGWRADENQSSSTSSSASSSCSGPSATASPPSRWPSRPGAPSSALSRCAPSADVMAWKSASAVVRSSTTWRGMTSGAEPVLPQVRKRSARRPATPDSLKTSPTHLGRSANVARDCRHQPAVARTFPGTSDPAAGSRQEPPASQSESISRTVASTTCRCACARDTVGDPSPGCKP